MRRLLPLIASGLVAFLVAGAHLFQALSAAHELQVEIEIVSPAPFQEDIPRVAHLLVPRGSDSYDDIEARCYGSAFLDQRTTFRFGITNRAATHFFFSPARGGALVLLRSVAVRVGNEKQVALVPLENLEAVQQVEILERKPGRVLLKTSSGDRAPLVRVNLAAPLVEHDQPRTGIMWAETAILFILAWAAVFGLAKALFLWRNVSLRAAFPFLIAAILAAAMALLSRFNAHPDEYLHCETARYYVAHLLPPALDDPAAAPSFSHYGFSYFQDLDVSYGVIGNFVALWSWLTSPEVAARFCNVLLFVVLSGYVVARLRSSPGVAVLLISPQIWYVFSYVNGDAWALAVATVAAVQLVAEDSALNACLRAPNWRSHVGGGLLFAVLLVLLLMAKRNYYLCFPFIALVALWKSCVWKEGGSALRTIARWAAIGLVALALYLPARVGHAAINRFELPRLQTEQAEKFAAPGYRPSEIAAGKGAKRMALRQQGVAFSDLFTKNRWATLTFQSFCGLYQWMSLPSPTTYYFVMGVLYSALLVTIAFALRRSSFADIAFVLLAFCGAAGVVLISAYHSWTADFQPQGRYIFPILPMLIFVLHRYRERLPSRALLLLFTGLFAASVFSFVFTGLRAIPQ